MALRSKALPIDPALLTEAALAPQAENESLRATIVTLKALIFGARSERLSTMGAEQSRCPQAFSVGTSHRLRFSEHAGERKRWHRTSHCKDKPANGGPIL
jgi:hypothetical protein